MVVVAALAAATTANVPLVEAAPISPNIDLSLESQYLPKWEFPIWVFTVSNNVNEGQDLRVVENVKVQFDPLPLPGETIGVSPEDTFDHDTGVWTIKELLPGHSVEIEIRPQQFFPLIRESRDAPIPHQLHAEIISSSPAEPPGNRDNNEAEGWVMGGRQGTVRFTLGDAGVGGGVVGSRHPDPGEQTTFRIRAHNDGAGNKVEGNPEGFYNVNDQLDVEVRIELSPGLSYGPMQQETFDTGLGIWSVGDLSDFTICETSSCNLQNYPGYQDLDVPVIVDSTGIPPEQLCLTATVVRTRPLFRLDPQKRENDVARVCLGQDPPVLVNEGEIVLWWLHDCVGVTEAPCGTKDELKLFARARRNDISLPTVQRIDEFRVAQNLAVTYLDPGLVIVQVHALGERRCSGTPEVCFWVSGEATGHDSTLEYGTAPGISVKYPPQSGGYTGHTFRISDVSPKQRPGTLSINRNDAGSFELLNVDAKPTFGPVNLTAVTESPDPLLIKFGALGTYKVELTFAATKSSTQYTASGEYTFHVGPISELAVMDSGEDSPLAAAGQTAYTIHAANHGPETAPAVLVTLTGVPQGAEVIATDGTYRETSCAGGLCQAEWVLGELPVSDGRPARGQTEYPTLTLIAPAGVPTPDIQASIANTQDYSVVIDGATHSTHYFDYIEENNAATIMAQPGAGGGAPGMPQDLQGSFFPTPPTAVVQWAEVDLLNGWPVSHYQVWKFEDEPGRACQAPRFDQAGAKIEGTLYLDSLYVEGSRTCYYVRAVNTWGVPGYWSEAVTATSEGLDQPRLSLEAGPDVSEGEDATFTVRASPAPVAGDTLVVYYTVADKRVDIETGGYVDAADEGRQDITIDNRGRATITVPTQSDDMDRPDGEVTVTLESGLGYTRGTPSTASVAVLDDDNPTVSFAASPTEPLSEGLQPNTHNVTVNLDPPSHAPLDIHYTLGGDVGDEDVRFSIPGSGRERSVRVPSGVTSVDIPVRLIDDTDTRDDTVLNLFLSPRHYYDLGSPASYTLTIIEDDGPRAEFDLAESGVDEDVTGSDNPHNVVVNLNPAPTGPVTINYSISGTARRDEHYSITGVTGSTGSVSAGAGATSVTIPVTIINNGAVEGDKTVVLTLLNSPGNYTLGKDRRHTVTIRDDDLPRASFAAATSNPGEGKGTHNVRVNLNPPAPPDGLILSYGVGGTAIRNRDYRVDNTVEVSGGASQVNIRVEITDDGDSEPDETVVLTLRAGSDYAVDDPGEHTLTIADDDLPLVAFAAEDASASERGGTHRATILVVPAPHTDITVKYTVGGTAARGAEDDFTVSGCDSDPCTVTVRRGQGRVDVPVRILNDDDNEGDETVVLTLTGGDGYDLALPVRHELTIRDDDAPVVSFAEAAVTVYEDNIGTHTVRVNLDRPAERAFTLVFNVGNTPSGDLGADGATDYSVPDPMEAQVIVGRDYVDIPVEVTPDTDNEADEIVVLTLKPGRGYSVGSADEYTLTILDDDNAGYPLVEKSRGTNPFSWNEGSGSFNPTWLVRENVPDDDPSNNFTGRVYFQYVGGTATPGEDFYLSRIGGQTVEEAGDTFWVESFWPEHTYQPDPDINWARFTFSIRRDNRSEGSETAIFRLLNGPGYRVKGDRQDYTVIIQD